jgi:N-glycosylase/DNA lyase
VEIPNVAKCTVLRIWRKIVLSAERDMTMNSTIFIEVPEGFSFRATVYSHGWCELRPFSLDEKNWRLSYVFSTDAGPVPAVISEENGRLKVELEGETTAPDVIVEQTRHILRLDEDLSGFYAALAKSERLRWVSERRAGRLLRSPTVFEDLVKTICTTNCSWGLTKNMVSNLVEKLGKAGLNTGLRAFPTAEAMASVDADFYRNEIRAGYRSPYFVELAESVASGRLDPEKWLISDLPTPELKKEMKKVKGVGDYAAENLLKLVGRYDGLALDSWLRSQFYKNHNSEKVCPDKKIERHYTKYGKWRGLAIWCDMTEKWIT